LADSLTQGVFVGFGAVGTLTIASGSSLNVSGGAGTGNQLENQSVLIVGNSTVAGGRGEGLLNLDGDGSTISILGNGSLAVLNVGQGNHQFGGPELGRGLMNVTNGADVLVDGGTGGGGFLSLARGGNSDGTLNLRGAGTTVTVTGAQGQVFVTNDFQGAVGGGVGRLTVSENALLNVLGVNGGITAAFGTGDGLITVDHGGRIHADGIFGTSFDSFTHASQTGRVVVNDTGVIEATTIFVGSGTSAAVNGTLTGTGTLIGGVQVQEGGLLHPGVVGATTATDRTLTIVGDLVQRAGTLEFSVAGFGQGQFDQLDVLGNIDLQGGAVSIDLLNGYIPQPGDPLPILIGRGGASIDESVAINVGTGLPGFELKLIDSFIIDPTTGQRIQATIGALGLLDTNVAAIAGLTPNHASLARAFDRLCTQTEVAPNLSPDELDLLQTCAQVRNAGNTPAQVDDALQALDTQEVSQTTNALLLFTIPQHGNMSQRINGIRAGSNPFDFSHLNLNVQGLQISGEQVERFLKTLIGGAASADEDFAKWGFFGDGNIYYGDKADTDAGNGFDYETVTFTTGADYRARDDLVFGGSFSYSEVNANFDEGGGMDVKSWAGSLFASYFVKEKYYIDLLGTIGRNELDTNRHIVYQTVLGGTNRRARSDTDGDQYSMSLGFGYDFNPGGWVFGPHGGANYTHLEADPYTEKSARGLNLTVDRQRATSSTVNLGAHVSYTFTPNWGVITPYANVDVVREFEDDAETINVSFAADRFHNDPTNPTPLIRVETDKRDSSYFVFSTGVSIQLVRGVAGFLTYRTARELSNIDLSDLTFGLRLERNL
jgi:uncharacterized protein YhjY with autotransporter beta-barrel domain